MSKTLYPYYERELHYLRHEAEGFARQYPAAAAQLLMDGGQSRDPHVERLIEGFALLSARIEKKLDDDFPEITDGLLSTLYPHYLAPIPSMAIAEFRADPASPQPAGVRIPRGAPLRTPPTEGVACRYRTCYETTLWPIEIEQASAAMPPFAPELDPPKRAQATLRLRLRTQGDLAFSEIALDRLRLHLDGDAALLARLYELLLNGVERIDVHDAESSDARRLASLPAEALQPVGFAEDEGLLPYPPTTSRAYRLLTELFAFPEKFAFVDLNGLGSTLEEAGRAIDLVVYLNDFEERLTAEVDAQTFRLGCTPIVNLFTKIAEPIRLDYTSTEYPIVPDAQQRHATEVYSVDRVVSAGRGSRREYAPLYGLNHENSWTGEDESRAFWHTRRVMSERAADGGSDVWLRVADRDFDPADAADQTITVHSTCTNRDLPTRLPAGAAGLRLQSDAPLPIRGVRCLHRPQAPLRPPLGKRAHWRLVSQLSMNHLSLCDERLAAPALQEILRLYDFASADDDRRQAIHNSQMIDGVVSLLARRTTCRIGGPRDGGFCRGVAVELTLDETSYRGVGAYLFASVLERFFAEYATVNSFTRLTFCTKQSGHIKTWPPRSGEAQLV